MTINNTDTYHWVASSRSSYCGWNEPCMQTKLVLIYTNNGTCRRRSTELDKQRTFFVRWYHHRQPSIFHQVRNVSVAVSKLGRINLIFVEPWLKPTQRINTETCCWYVASDLQNCWRWRRVCLPARQRTGVSRSQLKSSRDSLPRDTHSFIHIVTCGQRTCSTDLKLVDYHIMRCCLSEIRVTQTYRYLHRVSEKNCANFFLSELHQMSTNFGNFWQKDAEVATIMRDAINFHLT